MSETPTVWVGGLDDSVTEDILRAVFIPFGEISRVQIPLDQTTKRHRGFGFVTFVEREDAEHAVDNRNDSELFGRVINVRFAKEQYVPSKVAIWDEQAWATLQQQREISAETLVGQ